MALKMAPDMPTLINWDYCTQSIFPMISTYLLTIVFTATLVISTPKKSLARYASLPILVYLCITIFRQGFRAFPKNPVMVSNWACQGYNIFLQTTTITLLEHIDIMDPVISKPRNGHPPSYFVRLWRAMAYCVNARGINTPYQIKNVPSFDSKRPGWVPSRRRFLFTNFLWFVVLYTIQDSFYKPELALTIEDEKKFLGTDRENLVWRRPEDGVITGNEIGYRIFMEMLMWLIMIPLSVNLRYTFWSLVAVGLGLSEPKNWPPPFDSAKESYTLRLFWGKFWHQTLRWHFGKPAQFITHNLLNLPKKGLIQRYTNIFLVFFLSGIMHANQSLILLGAEGREIRLKGWYREIIFFMIMATGIMVEDGAQWLFRGEKVRKSEEKEGHVLWKRVLGYMWVWGLLVMVGPLIDYPKVRARLPTWLPFRLFAILR
ncbi:hypothetical protein TWF694_003245 [Orbilia ellipsospora]|uniref:Wax synthase domain-containing protein n=1 Tax=Orbilia ellipsospora TaxID=2528407 RepID=A0AAV9X1B5_9PEZI